MSHFQQHYAQLHDDALIELALTRELAPEAGDALKAELLKRGITDLSTHKKAIQAEIQAEESRRQKRIDHKQKVIGWRTKFLYFSALATCAYGIYRLIVPNADRPGDDGGLMLVLGLAFFLFAVVLSWLSTYWNKRVVNRRPPR